MKWNMNRLQYENWPRWVKVPYLCTFPVSCPVMMFFMMLGTIAFGLVLMGYSVLMMMILISDWAGWKS